MWVFSPVHFFLRNASNRIGSTAWSKLPGQFVEQIQTGVAHESNRSLLVERGLEAASSPFAFSIAVAEIYFLSSFILSTASDTLSLAF
jgi:hypothetical protein